MGMSFDQPVGVTYPCPIIVCVLCSREGQWHIRTGEPHVFPFMKHVRDFEGWWTNSGATLFASTHALGMASKTAISLACLELERTVCVLESGTSSAALIVVCSYIFLHILKQMFLAISNAFQSDGVCQTRYCSAIFCKSRSRSCSTQTSVDFEKMVRPTQVSLLVSQCNSLPVTHELGLDIRDATDTLVKTGNGGTQTDKTLHSPVEESSLGCIYPEKPTSLECRSPEQKPLGQAGVFPHTTRETEDALELVKDVQAAAKPTSETTLAVSAHNHRECSQPPSYIQTKKFARESMKNITRKRSKVSLQQLQRALPQIRAQQGSQPSMKQKAKADDADDSSDGETADDLTVLRKLSSASTMRFAPKVQRQVVATYIGHEDAAESRRSFKTEACRLASFHKYSKIPTIGRVWLTRVAAAGFYCPGLDSSTIKCAFCELRVEIEAFKKEDPMTVHRRRSPLCPFVQGQSSNVSIERQGQIAGLNVLHTFFWDTLPQGKEQPKAAKAKDQHTETPISATESQPSPEALQPASAGGFGSEGGASLGQFAASVSSLSTARETASSSSRSLDGQSPRTSLPAQSPGQVNRPPRGASVTVSRNTPVGATLHEQSSHQAPAQVSRQPARESSATAGNAGPQAPLSDSRAQASSPASAQPSEPARPQTPNLVTPQPSVEPGRTHTPESALPFQTARPASPPQPETTPSASSTSSPASNSRQSNDRQAASHTQAPPPATGEPVRQVVTYSQLGIYTQEPKRSDFAIATTRVATFNNWCHSDTHSPEEMAEAGFYFVGQGDLVRCFYCKGGLKSWAPHLRPWVEHARFFPKCPFIGQVKGQEFIDVVQELKERQETISADEVEEELQARRRISQDGEAQAQLGSEGAVGGVMGAVGGEEENIDVTQLAKAADDLENENKEILDTRICKICQINDVSILFLPCGHLASCAQCAPALRNCAICRQRVKGRVRVIDK